MDTTTANATNSGDPNSEPGTPAYLRAHGNHLLAEPSLYLQQHAHNPIDWYPWGDEALARAVAEDKLIFLSVGYSSCHWCHVMEDEVFSHDDVAAYLNEHYICIKVDREERPDLDEVYMRAAMIMNGSGGWPLNLFLTPELMPFFAGTYIPKDNFLALAERIISIHQDSPGLLTADAAEITKHIGIGRDYLAGDIPDLADIVAIVQDTVGSFDEVWGGFAVQQKFPSTPRWLMLLHYYRRTGDKSVGGQLRLTLDRMIDGGLYDHVGGGFHRYCTDRSWLIPHFEKMLYDNAQLVSLYTEASLVFNEPKYAVAARETLDFLLREMREPGGAFFASFDADSGGEEGTYYVWTLAELVEVCGKEDGTALARLLGVTVEGNFEGANVLTRRVDIAAAAAEFGRSTAELTLLFAKYQPALAAYRQQRVSPGLDTKVVTAWNGLMLAALSQAYLVFNDERYRQAAVEVADYLWQHHRNLDGQLLRATTDGEPGGTGILDDYAAFAVGLLELYSATGDFQQYERAAELIHYADVHFAAGAGVYFLSEDNVEAPLGRQVIMQDGVEPCGNSLMLHALSRLAVLSGDEMCYQQLDLAFVQHSGEMHALGMEAAWWFDLILRLSGPQVEVVIAGDRGSSDTQAMLAEYAQLLPPHAVLNMIPAAGATPKEITAMPALDGRTALNGTATAYVCKRGACQSPTQNSSELQGQLMRSWQY